jgi:hypothetical protein
MVMQRYGGLLPAEEAVERSIGMLECGPAAGVIGSRALGQLLNQSDVIATDMGGTTFKVSVIQNHEIEYAREPMVDRYHYTQPKIEVVSIGAGGGSIVSFAGAVRRIGRARPLTSRPARQRLAVASRPNRVLLLTARDPDIFLGGGSRRDAGKWVFDEATRNRAKAPPEAAFRRDRVGSGKSPISSTRSRWSAPPIRGVRLHAQVAGCCRRFGSDLHEADRGPVHRLGGAFLFRGGRYRSRIRDNEDASSRCIPG